MPQALPAIGVFLAGIGSTVTFGFATGIGAAMIGGALVGAAIGGLTSLVTGGDIGKGLLFGALGGAVMGGISGLTIPTALSGAGMAPGGMGSAGFATQHVGAAAVAEHSALVAAGGGAAAGAGMSAGEGLMYGSVGASVIEGGLGMAGSMMEGAGMQEMKEAELAAANEQAEKNRALQLKLAEMNAELQKELKPEDHFGEQLAENIRQFDLQLTQREKEHNESMGLRYAQLREPYEEAEKARKRAGASLEGIQFKESYDTIAGSDGAGKGVYAAVVEKNKEIRGT